ncbi:salicylate/benzoate carboxyl methyltransferase-like [Gossypium australe]|uniref:Salicylate/benzoate carboxyl methyltransferase-like n=1 Tax=Gossypium australe TaxID=47621 RepID=A0A5B6WIV7_9ROSI|nr:salicylate/benzoate carboxyl methyltransferase-like [Gossypium australe]
MAEAMKEVMLKLRPIIEESSTLKFSNTVPTYMKVADLGRFSGPNTFMTISHIIDTVHGIFQQEHLKLPKFKVLLNDLPENDFNAVFKSVPGFFERLKKEKRDIMQKRCFTRGVAGSFYHRMRSPVGWRTIRGTYIWQDQVLPKFYKLMWTNFRNTFTSFLSMRSKEMIPQGQMVLTLIARKNPNPYDEGYRLELLAKSLLDLVAQGVIKEADVDSYLAKKKWLSLLRGKYLLKLTSSKFFTEQLRNKDLGFNFYKKMGKNIANTMRAILEPILYCHFGDAIIEEGLQQMQQIL